jgi:hypothetical protein
LYKFPKSCQNSKSIEIKKIKSVLKLSIEFGPTGPDLLRRPTNARAAAFVRQPSRLTSRWCPCPIFASITGKRTRLKPSSLLFVHG